MLYVMVILRCTRKLLARLPPREGGGAPTGDHDAAPAASTTRLGDWYANLMIVARRPLVLCVAERSLFAVVIPLWEARTLVPRWRVVVERRLLALGVAPGRVADELAAMADVRVTSASYGATSYDAGGVSPGECARSGRARSPTVGRRMVGMLTDMAWQCEERTTRADNLERPDFAAMEAALDDLLCTPLAYRRPADVTRELFAEEPPLASAGALRLVR